MKRAELRNLVKRHWPDRYEKKDTGWVASLTGELPRRVQPKIRNRGGMFRTEQRKLQGSALFGTAGPSG